MSALLDEEMPQQRPNRPVALWLLLTACIAGLGVWLLWPNHNPSGDKQPQPVPPALTAVPSGSGKPDKAERPTEDPSPKADQSASIMPFDVQIQQPQSQWRERNLLIQHVAPKGNIHISEPESHSIQDVERNLFKYTPVFLWQDNNPDQAATTPVPLPALAPLPPAAPVALEHSQPIRHPDRIKVAFNSTKKRTPVFSFGLVSGMSAFQVRKNPGLHGGLTVNMDFARQRIGLQTGLIYRYQRYDKQARPVLPVTYKAYSDATGNDDIAQSQAPNTWLYLANNNRIIVPVTESHQLEIPALAYLRLGNRWRFYGGMTFLRHVWVESSSVGLFTYNLKVVTTPDDNDAKGNLNNLITGQLPRWEKNWQTGLSFQPLKRLELGIYYRSVWRGMPVLSDFHKLFDSCSTCDAQYPKARENTLSAIRPQAFQFNVFYKF